MYVLFVILEISRANSRCVHCKGEKKLKKGLFSNVVGNMLSPLKIGDRPNSAEPPSRAADCHDHEDYLRPVTPPPTPPAVKPKPGQSY